MPIGSIKMTSCNTSDNHTNKNANAFATCPVNGKPYGQVSLQTILHHVRKPWNKIFPQKKYYFCSDSCRHKFEVQPTFYLNPDETSNRSDEGHKYTCPMHPEVIQNKPGNCPKCGMALEWVEGSDEKENTELLDMRRRFVWALFLTIPLLIVSMGDMFPSKPISSLLSLEYKGLLEFILCTPICLYAAWPFYERFVV